LERVSRRAARGRQDDRSLIFDRLSEVAPPPPGVTREDILAADPRAMQLWRESLGLPGAKKGWLNWRDAF
jgi:hypothetical protein